MVLSLELPIRRSTPDPVSDYDKRFGALPPWLDELDAAESRALLRQALKRGAPLTPADYLN